MEAAEACCPERMNEKTKCTHFLCCCKEKPLCFRWVSASVSSRPASAPVPRLAPCHPDRVWHCGTLLYKSSGSSADAWPQIRPARCLNASISNPQGSRLADDCMATGRKSLCASGCECVCEVIANHKAVKGWWVCVLSYSLLDSYTHIHRHR